MANLNVVSRTIDGSKAPETYLTPFWVQLNPPGVGIVKHEYQTKGSCLRQMVNDPTTLPPPAAHQLMTLVLDMDETLLSARKGFVAVRPYTHVFLSTLKRFLPSLELILWSAASAEHVAACIDVIDPNGTIFDHVVCRGPSWAAGAIAVSNAAAAARARGEAPSILSERVAATLQEVMASTARTTVVQPVPAVAPAPTLTVLPVTPPQGAVPSLTLLRDPSSPAASLHALKKVSALPHRAGRAVLIDDAVGASILNSTSECLLVPPFVAGGVPSKRNAPSGEGAEIGAEGDTTLLHVLQVVARAYYCGMSVVDNWRNRGGDEAPLQGVKVEGCVKRSRESECDRGVSLVPSMKRCRVDASVRAVVDVKVEAVKIEREEGVEYDCAAAVDCQQPSVMTHTTNVTPSSSASFHPSDAPPPLVLADAHAAFRDAFVTHPFVATKSVNTMFGCVDCAVLDVCSTERVGMRVSAFWNRLKAAGIETVSSTIPPSRRFHNGGKRLPCPPPSSQFPAGVVSNVEVLRAARDAKRLERSKQHVMGWDGWQAVGKPCEKEGVCNHTACGVGGCESGGVGSGPVLVSASGGRLMVELPRPRPPPPITRPRPTLAPQPPHLSSPPGFDDTNSTPLRSGAVAATAHSLCPTPSASTTASTCESLVSSTVTHEGERCCEDGTFDSSRGAALPPVGEERGVDEG